MYHIITAVVDDMPERIQLQWRGLDGLGGGFQWGLRIQRMLGRRIVLQAATNVVSTMGGAHSQLGESSRRHALQAEVRARQMLLLATRLEDEALACRCNAYRALAMIQLNKLRRAKIILDQCIVQAERITDEKASIVVAAVQARYEFAISDSGNGR